MESAKQQLPQQMRTRIEQLERDIAEKERKLLQLREEILVAKEETQQKTKLVIQLQKQIVELESRLTRSSNSAQGGNSLLGALLGAASGEGQELTKLRRDYEVQQEELFKKISENERLQVRLADLSQLQEREKAEWTLMLENEIKKSNRVQNELLRRSEELDVIKSQNDSFSREMIDKDRQLHEIRSELSRITMASKVASRREARQNELFQLYQQRIVHPILGLDCGSAMSFLGQPSAFSSVAPPKFTTRRLVELEEVRIQNETSASLADVCFWLSEWRQSKLLEVNSESQSNAMKAMVDACERIRQTFSTLSPNAGESAVLPLIKQSWDLFARATKTLAVSFEFAKRVNTVMEKFNEPNLRFLEELLVELKPLESDSSVVHLVASLAHIHAVWTEFRIQAQNCQSRIRREEEEEEQAKMNMVAPQEHSPPLPVLVAVQPPKWHGNSSEKEDSAKSDESFLNSLEDFLQPKPALSTPVRPLSSLRKQQDSQDDEALLVSWDEPSVEVKSNLTALVPTENDVKELKRHYHLQSMTNLNKIAELKRSLDQSRKEAAVAQSQVQQLNVERSDHVKVLQECKDAMRRAREELEGTRESYDAQLRNFSERIMELEQQLQGRDEEIQQLKAEGMLMNQLKKTIHRKS